MERRTASGNSKASLRQGNLSGDLPRNAKFNVGDPLEYRVARLLIHLGFFVRRGREIYTIGGLDQATDLDVFAVRYADMFRREVQICECKSGKEGPLDRVFWIVGVKDYVGAARATIVRKSTKWNIKDFASQAGVEIIDLPRLEALERTIGIELSYWPSISNRSFFQQYQQEWNRYLATDPVLRELYYTLAGEVRFHEPLSAISFLLHHARALTRDLEESRRAPELLLKFLLSDVIAHLAMFCMRVAEFTFNLSEADRNGYIKKGLTYGGLDANLTQRIFRNAERIAAESVKYYTGQEVRLDPSLFQMPEPPNVKEVQELVALLVEEPLRSSTFGAMADLVLSESYFKHGKGSAIMGKIFPYTDLRERLALVYTYLAILRRIGAIPDNKTHFGGSNGTQIVEAKADSANTDLGTSTTTSTDDSEQPIIIEQADTSNALKDIPQSEK